MTPFLIEPNACRTRGIWLPHGNWKCFLPDPSFNPKIPYELRLSGVYLFWQKGPIYVGESKNVANRLSTHLKHQLFGPGDKMFFKTVEVRGGLIFFKEIVGIENRLCVEYELIRDLSPRLNIASMGLWRNE